MTKLKPPFAWVGGKRKLTEDVIKRFSEHKKYVEVFAGGLAVLYAKERSEIEIVNDIDDDLINLHRVIRDRPQSLSAYLDALLASRKLFCDIRDKKIVARNNIERAAHYYFLIMQSFGSKKRTFAMNAKRRKPKSLLRDFAVYSQRLRGVTIEAMDYERLIKEYDGVDTLFYLDPPYAGTERRYVNGDFTKDDHEKLATILREIKGKFVLSYNDSSLIRELYKDFNIESVETTYILNRAKRKRATELIITN